MTKAAALHQWFNQFLPFYPASSVPDDVVFPYGTYAIGLGGMQVICDDGVIWIKKGNPWCQSLQDSEDLRIKRRYLNITLEYNTF